MRALKCIISKIFFKLKYFNQDVKMGHMSYLSRGVSCEGHNHFGSHTVFTGTIGYASNIAEDCYVSGYIGRYCSIGRGTKVVVFTHPTKRFISTHPAFYSLLKQSGFTYVKKQKFPDANYVDKDKKIGVNIGNDVFIGAGVIILGGVNVGDGAIIGAGSVVTKDVAPYSIVAGVPARIIRFRFEEDDVDFLQKLQWWNKPNSWIEEHAEYFDDINRLKDYIDKEFQSSVS